MFNHARPEIVAYKTAASEHSEHLNVNSWLDAISNLAEVDIRHEAEEKTLWLYMKPAGRPCFTPGLLTDFNTVIHAVAEAHGSPEQAPQYVVLGSRLPGVFNLGGDLARFREMILAADREGLRHYAYSCVHPQYKWALKMDAPICTIALVQGDALGGGFEVTLTHDVIVAEKSAKFGLPEILFNLFPGMGAYSFLSRRLDPVRAERLMTSGKLYTAEEMHAMGVVDVLAEDGAGEEAVRNYIEQHRRASKARLAIAKLRNIMAPLSLQELLDITDLWVETALTLDERDLRKMRHLVGAQDRRAAEMADEENRQRASA